MKPVRLTLSRKAGFDLQALSLATNGLPAVNCTWPSGWRNTIRIVNGPIGPNERNTAEDVVTEYRYRCRGNEALIRSALAGKNLACWCKPGSPCHCDVLLEIANAPAPSTK